MSQGLPKMIPELLNELGISKDISKTMPLRGFISPIDLKKNPTLVDERRFITQFQSSSFLDVYTFGMNDTSFQEMVEFTDSMSRKDLDLTQFYGKEYAVKYLKRDFSSMTIDHHFKKES